MENMQIAPLPTLSLVTSGAPHTLEMNVIPATPGTRRLRCIAEDIGKILEDLEKTVVECETDSMHDKLAIAAFEKHFAQRVFRLRAVQARKQNMSLKRLPSSPRRSCKMVYSNQPNPRLVRDTLDTNTIHRNDYRVDMESILTSNSMACKTEEDNNDARDDNKFDDINIIEHTQEHLHSHKSEDRHNLCTMLLCLRFTNMLCRRMDTHST